MHISGFLVVLREREAPSSTLNRLYKGLDRVPSYPSPIPEEAAAMEQYVFGDYRDTEGFIPTLERARALLGMFNSSSRRFELVYCVSSSAGATEVDSEGFSFLGLDVATCGGDFWSIVGDFPAETSLQQFRSQLNHYGLFESCERANEYLSEYRTNQLADWEMPFAVFAVYSIGAP